MIRYDIKDQMYFVLLSHIKSIRLMYAKYKSVVSSLLVNNLLGSLDGVQSGSTPYINMYMYDDLILILL